MRRRGRVQRCHRRGLPPSPGRFAVLIVTFVIVTIVFVRLAIRGMFRFLSWYHQALFGRDAQYSAWLDDVKRSLAR